MTWVQCKAQKKNWLQQEHSWGQLSFVCHRSHESDLSICSELKVYNFLLLSKEHIECLLLFLCIYPGMPVYQTLIHLLNKSIHFLIKRKAISYSQQNTNRHIQDNTVIYFFFFKHKSCRFYSDLKQHCSSHCFYFSWYLKLIFIERNQSPDTHSV